MKNLLFNDIKPQAVTKQQLYICENEIYDPKYVKEAASQYLYCRNEGLKREAAILYKYLHAVLDSAVDLIGENKCRAK